ncbi:MAG: helix-turn-helix domain-containing protein [Nitrososphaerota archaeon]|nr:helix-turn-helix domain-containing protein [Nitrososphaerota archaeon]MDG6919417.1 helix-turn-helix domain-containing protein [Nitrososphaerota archaeon]
MPMIEARVRLEHDCPYTRFTKSIPKAEMFHWCSRESDVLEVAESASFEPSELDVALNRLLKDLGAKAVRRIPLGPKRRMIVQKHNYSSMKQNVNAVIEEHNCMEVQPTVYKDGFEWYRILAFDNRDLIRLFGALSRWADVHVVSRETFTERSARDTIAVSIRRLLGGLTERQLKALLVALSAGYYDTPRKVRTADISQRMSTPRTTYETHLRKAEGKVLKALVPYLELMIGLRDGRANEESARS